MNVVVVGAGLAGASAVEELRKLGHEGGITLIGEEDRPPYERPPLSKGVLLGKETPESTYVHDAEWYADHDVDLRLGSPVREIDRTRRRVLLDDGEVGYDRLLLATGSSPRRLDLADRSGADVVYLRTFDDAVRLRSRLSGRIVVIGAGWIGLEVAAAARQAGAEVTVIESAPLPLLRVLGPEVAGSFADLHRQHSVDLRLDASITRIDREDDGVVVTLSTQERVTGDLIVVGVGVVPNDHLARTSGLATDDGVLVDAALRTSDEFVFAAGDVARQDHPLLEESVRIEHWDNAIHQGRHAAHTMMGEDSPYLRMPYFFTDQYDLGMEYVGHVGPNGYDHVVVRQEPDQDTMTALWTRGGRVRAGMHVNDWDSVSVLRDLVGRPVDEAVLDPRVPLADLTDPTS